MTIIIKIEHLHHHILFHAIYLILAFWCWSWEEISFCGNNFVTDAAGEKLCQWKVSLCSVLKFEGWLGKNNNTNCAEMCVLSVAAPAALSKWQSVLHCTASNTWRNLLLHPEAEELQNFQLQQNLDLSDTVPRGGFCLSIPPYAREESAFNKFFALILSLKNQITPISPIPDGFSKLDDITPVFLESWDSSSCLPRTFYSHCREKS